MTTGVFHLPGATGGGRYKRRWTWTSEADARLMDYVADEWPFDVIATRMFIPAYECERRFALLAKRMGADRNAPMMPVHHAVRVESDEYACSCGKRWPREEGREHP